MERTRPEWPGTFEMGGSLPQSPEIAAAFAKMPAAESAGLYGPFAPRPVPPPVASQFSVQSHIHVVLRPKVGKP